MYSRPTPPPSQRAGPVQSGPHTGDTGDPGANHRQQARVHTGLVRNQGADPVGLILLNVNQEHVRRVFADLERKRAQEVRLHGLNPDDEEAAKADRKQDDTRLVSRPGQIENRVSHDETCSGAKRLDDANQTLAGQVEQDGHGRESTAYPDSDLPRRCLPTGQQHQSYDQQYDDPCLYPIARWCCHEPPSKQRQRFDRPHLEQWSQREEQRDQHADAEPL